MKCSQCGCEDLEKVNFPYKAILDEVATGISGESSFYDLREKTTADTYICTNCGHFEFFNSKLAKSVLEKRAKNAKTQGEIDVLNKKISDKNNEIKNFKNQISLIKKQLENIDITIRQSNEFKTKQQELVKKLKLLEKEFQQLEKQKSSLKKKQK